MNILFLLTQDLDSPSGLGRYWPISKELSNIGYNICIVALHPSYDNLIEKEITTEGVQIKYVSQMHVLKKGNNKKYYTQSQLLKISTNALIELSKEAIKTQADIIHIGKPHPMNGVAGLISATLRDSICLLDCDDIEIAITNFSSKWQRFVVNLFEHYLPFFVEHITTNTQYNQKRIIQSGVQADKITYIPNGVDRDRFNTWDHNEINRLRQTHNLVDKKVIAYIGSLSQPGHPVGLLLEAYKMIVQKLPDTRLLIVGGGEDTGPLMKLSHSMRLADNVLFVGRVPPDKIVNYYKLADVSIDPVLDDDAAKGRSPLKLFESWATNTPYITGNVGDRKFLLGNPPAGILVKPGDAYKLSQAIISVLKYPRYADELRELGFQRISGYYWDTLVMKIDKLYNNILSRRY